MELLMRALRRSDGKETERVSFSRGVLRGVYQKFFHSTKLLAAKIQSKNVKDPRHPLARTDESLQWEAAVGCLELPPLPDKLSASFFCLPPFTDAMALAANCAQFQVEDTDKTLTLGKKLIMESPVGNCDGKSDAGNLPGIFSRISSQHIWTAVAKEVADLAANEVALSRGRKNVQVQSELSRQASIHHPAENSCVTGGVPEVVGRHQDVEGNRALTLATKVIEDIDVNELAHGGESLGSSPPIDPIDPVMASDSPARRNSYERSFQVLLGYLTTYSAGEVEALIQSCSDQDGRTILIEAYSELYVKGVKPA
jgi:hypothetical protein